MRTKIAFAALVVATLLLALAVTATSFAYTGVTGRVVDSEFLGRWQWGGDVYIVDGDGDIVSTCEVSQAPGTRGDFLCTYGDDDIGSTPGFVGGSPDTNPVTILVDFTCTVSGNCTGGPDGTPKTNQVTYEELPVPVVYNAGFIRTGTNPTAITLTGFATEGGGTNLLLIAAAGAVILLAALTLVAMRRRKSIAT